MERKYNDVIQELIKLLEDKDLVYGCKCSRSDIKNALTALGTNISQNKIKVYP